MISTFLPILVGTKAFPSSLQKHTLIEDKKMIYTLISLLVLFWLVGLVAHVGGGFIHGLLVLALAVFVFDMLTGRRTTI